MSAATHFHLLLQPQAVFEAVGKSEQLQALPVRQYRKADTYPGSATEAMRAFDMQLGDLPVPEAPRARGRRRD